MAEVIVRTLIALMYAYYYICLAWRKISGYVPHCLGVLYSVSVIAAAAVLLGDPAKSKADWTIGLASFALVCYITKLIILLRTAQVDFLLCYTRDGRRVCFIHLNHIIELIIPILYYVFALAYLEEIKLEEKYFVPYIEEAEEVLKWNSVMYWFEIAIFVSGAIIAAMSEWIVYYYRDYGNNQLVSMQTVDDVPMQWYEILLQDRADSTTTGWFHQMITAAQFYTAAVRNRATRFFPNQGPHTFPPV